MSQLKSSEIFAAHPQSGQFTAPSLEALVTRLGTSITKCRGGGWLHSSADKGNCFFLYKFKVKISVYLLKYPFANLCGTDSEVNYLPGYKDNRR